MAPRGRRLRLNPLVTIGKLSGSHTDKDGREARAARAPRRRREGFACARRVANHRCAVLAGAPRQPKRRPPTRRVSLAWLNGHSNEEAAGCRRITAVHLLHSISHIRVSRQPAAGAADPAGLQPQQLSAAYPLSLEQSLFCHIDLARGFLVAGDRHRRLISAYQHIIQLSATQWDAPAQARTIPARFSQRGNRAPQICVTLTTIANDRSIFRVVDC